MTKNKSNPQAKVRKWSPADEARVVEMVKAGKPYRAIAAEFGITRNACIGRVDRMARRMEHPDLKRPPRPKKPPAARSAQGRRAEAGPRPAPLPRPSAPPTRIDAFAEGYMGQTGRVDIIDLEPTHCRFPVDQPHPARVKYCGLEAAHGSPWCQQHGARVFGHHE